jgi:TRAP-type C4-dicarboxylate transport system permease small subunit
MLSVCSVSSLIIEAYEIALLFVYVTLPIVFVFHTVRVVSKKVENLFPADPNDVEYIVFLAM